MRCMPITRGLPVTSKAAAEIYSRKTSFCSPRFSTFFNLKRIKVIDLIPAISIIMTLLPTELRRVKWLEWPVGDPM